MCGSMVYIQSATAEIRRGNKKEERQKKPQGKNIMSASATQGGRSRPTSGYATWFMAGGATRIAHYDVIDDVITRKV